MSTTDSISEQRDSFRCPVAESRRRCALRIGAEKIPVRLLDESVGGFAVLVDRPPNLDPEQTVLLQTDSGWFNVRVRSTVAVPPPKNCEVVESEEPTEWFRLGLQRLGDAVPLDEPSVSPFAGDIGSRLRQWSPANGWMSVSSVLLALAALAVPLVLVGMVWYAWRLEDGNAVSMNDPWDSFSKRWSEGSPLPVKPLLTEGSAAHSRNAFPVGRTSVPNAFGPKSEGDLRSLVWRLPGPTAMGLPEVIRRLRLTEKQQVLIRQHIDTMAETMRKLDLDPKLRGAKRRRINQLRDKLLDDYLLRALDLLTPEQQAEWKKLRDASPTKQSPAL